MRLPHCTAIFNNLPWCEYMWECFPPKDILGFLLEKTDVTSNFTLNNNLNNLKMYIWERLLKNGHCYFDFWRNFDECKDKLLEILIYKIND